MAPILSLRLPIADHRLTGGVVALRRGGAGLFRHRRRVRRLLGRLARGSGQFVDGGGSLVGRGRLLAGGALVLGDGGGDFAGGGGKLGGIGGDLAAHRRREPDGDGNRQDDGAQHAVDDRIGDGANGRLVGLLALLHDLGFPLFETIPQRVHISEDSLTPAPGTEQGQGFRLLACRPPGSELVVQFDQILTLVQHAAQSLLLLRVFHQAGKLFAPAP